MHKLKPTHVSASGRTSRHALASSSTHQHLHRTARLINDPTSTSPSPTPPSSCQSRLLIHIITFIATSTELAHGKSSLPHHLTQLINYRVNNNPASTAKVHQEGLAIRTRKMERKISQSTSRHHSLRHESAGRRSDKLVQTPPPNCQAYIRPHDAS